METQEKHAVTRNRHREKNVRNGCNAVTLEGDLEETPNDRKRFTLFPRAAYI
jgi:hypothetical protein